MKLFSLQRKIVIKYYLFVINCGETWQHIFCYKYCLKPWACIVNYSEPCFMD
jgi:hypothetical protein